MKKFEFLRDLSMISTLEDIDLYQIEIDDEEIFFRFDGVLDGDFTDIYENFTDGAIIEGRFFYEQKTNKAIVTYYTKDAQEEEFYIYDKAVIEKIKKILEQV